MKLSISSRYSGESTSVIRSVISCRSDIRRVRNTSWPPGRSSPGATLKTVAILISCSIPGSVVPLSYRPIKGASHPISSAKSAWLKVDDLRRALILVPITLLRVSTMSPKKINNFICLRDDKGT
uniref:Uncharacterized protein n=1 Tax=Pseudomonas syringae pv. maculicola str. M6 TaxID=698750 RepID=Q93TD2_PSEYM|nr:unknown [Pseudomonas syringae pv. maculicola str. M6]